MTAVTWEITIKCRDGLRLHFSEQNASPPANGEIVQTANAGQIIKARIDSCYKRPPQGGNRHVYFQVIATEHKLHPARCEAGRPR